MSKKNNGIVTTAMANKNFNRLKKDVELKCSKMLDLKEANIYSDLNAFSKKGIEQFDQGLSSFFSDGQNFPTFSNFKRGIKGTLSFYNHFKFYNLLGFYAYGNQWQAVETIAAWEKIDFDALSSFKIDLPSNFEQFKGRWTLKYTSNLIRGQYGQQELRIDDDGRYLLPNLNDDGEKYYFKLEIRDIDTKNVTWLKIEVLFNKPNRDNVHSIEKLIVEKNRMYGKDDVGFDVEYTRLPNL